MIFTLVNSKMTKKMEEENINLKMASYNKVFGKMMNILIKIVKIKIIKIKIIKIRIIKIRIIKIKKKVKSQ